MNVIVNADDLGMSPAVNDAIFKAFDEGLLRSTTLLVHGPAFGDAVTRLRDFCARLTELKDRPLFYALSRRAWELREELDLLDRYLASPELAVASDFHLPGTYRGGFVPRLQRLLVPRADGSFAPPP